MLTPEGWEGFRKGKKGQRKGVGRLTQKGEWDVQMCKGEGEHGKAEGKLSGVVCSDR